MSFPIRILLALTAALLAAVTPTVGGGTASARSPGRTAAAPRGEVWEWALGENATTDPDLAPYRNDLSGSGIHEFSLGWEATVATDGTVTQVSVYNDETAIGLPPSSTSYQAYKGRLPGGLSWDDTASDVVGKLGAPAATGYAPGGGEAGWTRVEGKYNVKAYFFHGALHDMVISSSSTPAP